MNIVSDWRQRLLIVLLLTQSTIVFSAEGGFEAQNRTEHQQEILLPYLKIHTGAVKIICEGQLGYQSAVLTHNGGGAQTQQGGQQGRVPPPPPKVHVIDGSYIGSQYQEKTGSDDEDDGDWQPPKSPEKKPVRDKYNGMSAFELLLLTLQYAYANQSGNLVHTLIADFLQTETMHFNNTTLGDGVQAFAVYFNSAVAVGQTAVQAIDDIVAAYTQNYGDSMSLTHMVLFIDNHYADHQIFELIRLFRSCFNLKPLSQ